MAAALQGVGPSPGLARLRHLYVKVDHRRHGVGRQLVAYARIHAAASFRRIQLRTHSPEASLFYERLGFVRERGIETVTHVRALGPEEALWWRCR
jgi:GNAT superfamily N-acetyltransferase